MTSKNIRQKILELELGRVFDLEDLGIAREEQQAAIVALGRLARTGEIERLSRGRYYRPKPTAFGTIGPSIEERLRDLLYRGNTPTGYLTGLYAFNLLGLTTQQSSILEIGTNFPRRNSQRGIYSVRFVLQKNPINAKNIEFLRLLDCLKWIKKIPDTTIDRSYSLLRAQINSYTAAEQKLLVTLSLKYSPLTRALLGSMLGDESLSQQLASTLSPVTKFRIGLSPSPESTKWNIL